MKLILIRALWFVLGFLIAYVAQEVHYAEEHEEDEEC